MLTSSEHVKHQAVKLYLLVTTVENKSVAVILNSECFFVACEGGGQQSQKTTAVHVDDEP